MSQFPGGETRSKAVTQNAQAVPAEQVDEGEPLSEPSGEPRPIVPPPVGSHILPSSKIRTFEQKLISGRHEDAWQRTPNANGTGAIHVKSFHCKLTDEALHYLDQQINEWLDAHPQYEVKFVTTAMGDWTGKLKEPNMVVMVWV